LNLSDRRAILAELNADPLYLILSGILAIGTLTALLLALIGNLLTSWLSAHTRLTNFAVLRAIGSTPLQVASMLTWEQALVYLTGLLLGVGIGAFIVQAVIPTLTLTDFNTSVSSNQFYTLQTTFPTQIVLPSSLLLVLLALVAIYGVALTMMVRIVSRPSLSQTLRLNED
ncbi:MAG TPA: FtsX-like permease family protein, partial [Ktedonobacteraceae bacterium]|nr:FtsX-like permease family protein [Ktedonobacteraceae bacterium]